MEYSVHVCICTCCTYERCDCAVVMVLMYIMQIQIQLRMSAIPNPHHRHLLQNMYTHYILSPTALHVYGNSAVLQVSTECALQCAL